MVFSIAEIVAGVITLNSALITSAIHDFLDGISMILTDRFDERWSRSADHALYCTSRGLLGIAMALLIPAASALGLLVESDRSISVTDLTIAVIIGAISLTLNLWGLIATRRRHHLLRLGVLAHFVEDSIGSIVVIVTSSLAYVYQTPRYNWIGSLIIIGVTLSVGVIAALHTAIKIGHREPRHDHLSEPTEEHELHSPTATS